MSSAEATVFSNSFVNLRHHLKQINMLSTIHQRGKTSTPLTE
ncbi:hypothetical protein EDF68_12810 [Ochrobactrum sp. BH3]|nr:hypothetical protein EDF68_12810 [Ochrobactrum sp. BH3]